MKTGRNEGLKLLRLLMALGSVSPVFVLWAIHGTALVPDVHFLSFCAAMVVVPNAVFWYRIRTACRRGDMRELAVGTVVDDRLEKPFIYLVCLFAILSCASTPATWRSLAAALAGLALVVLVFWRLNLHYLNAFLVLSGYRFFTIRPAADGNPLSGRSSHVLITPRTGLAPGERIPAYRLTDTVYFEPRT